MRKTLSENTIEAIILAFTFLLGVVFLWQFGNPVSTFLINPESTEAQIAAILIFTAVGFLVFQLLYGLVMLVDTFIFLTIWFFTTPEDK